MRTTVALLLVAIVTTWFATASAAQFVTIARGPQAPASTTAEAATQPAPALPSAEAPTVPLAESSEADATPAPPRDIDGARIAIPRLAIDLPLTWGDALRDTPSGGYAGGTPERVALLYPASRLPGSGGNSYVYAHARDGMFLALWNVRLGDAVLVTWPDGWTLRYAVGRIVGRVPATDLSWLDAGGPERLTLQTSTGPAAADPRFVVIASPQRAGPNQ